jgi:hypothetical protein
MCLVCLLEFSLTRNIIFVKDEQALANIAAVMDHYQLLDDPDQTIPLITKKTQCAFKGKDFIYYCLGLIFIVMLLYCRLHTGDNTVW